MRLLSLPTAALPRLGSYQLHVLASGHVPGVLSGAELRGKARRFGARYRRSRDQAAALLRPHGVTVGTVMTSNRRRAVGWVSAETGEPVRVLLIQGEAH